MVLGLWNALFGTYPTPEMRAKAQRRRDEWEREKQALAESAAKLKRAIRYWSDEAEEFDRWLVKQGY